MLGLLKIVGAFLHPYRMAFLGLGLVAVLTTIVGFTVHYRTLSIENRIYAQTVENQEQALSDTRKELANRNDRIQSMNEERLAELQDAKARLEEALEIAQEARAERDTVKLSLKRLRSQMVEIAKNDAEYARWSRDPVPTAAWSLLQQASEGTGLQ